MPKGPSGSDEDLDRETFNTLLKQLSLGTVTSAVVALVIVAPFCLTWIPIELLSGSIMALSLFISVACAAWYTLMSRVHHWQFVPVTKLFVVHIALSMAVYAGCCALTLGASPKVLFYEFLACQVVVGLLTGFAMNMSVPM